MKTKFYLRKGSKKSTLNFEFRNGIKIKFRASTGFWISNEKDWDAVRSTGTTKSIETLQSELKRTRSNDLKYFIQSAIEDINERKNSSS